MTSPKSVNSACVNVALAAGGVFAFPGRSLNFLRCHRWIGLIAAWILAGSLAPRAHAQAGAATPFTTLEAEAGTLGGGATVRSFVLGSPVPTVATLELEASGGALVELSVTGQSISWTNPVANANTIVIRNSIPDAPNGGGIEATIDLYVDGVFRQAITVSSKQSWVYRNSTTNPDDPHGGGMPFHFYNEDRAFITGPPIAAGSTIKLEKDAANDATVYDIDCIDLENAPPPLTQPANSLSIISYGADPNFTTDSTVAIQNAVNAARTQGKSVWIPQGKFMVASLASTPIDLTGVAVHGAGVWYSTIYKNVPLPPPTQPWRSELQVGSGTTLTDIFVDSDAIYRGIGGAGGDSSGITAKGAGGWLIDHVWVQHSDAQWLTGTNGTIQNSRVADSWADGINLNNGNTPDPDKAGINLTAQNNFVRGGGDDGIATYSDSGASGTNPEMSGTHILNNTSVAPYWANALRVAGGKNVVVQNNLVTDPAANNGMDVSVFGTTGNPLDSAMITGNVILRGGGWNGTNRHGMSVGSHSSGAFANSYTNATISGNTIKDSRRAGLTIGTTLEKLTVSGNTIDHPAVQGIWINSGVTGTGTFDSNTVSNLNTGQVPFQNDSPNTFTTTLTNNSWQGPPTPTGLRSTSGTTQVALSWAASTGAANYNVKRATVSGGPYTTISSPTATNYTDTGVTGGVTYYYVVSAVNSAGESANSSQVSGTPSGDFSISATPSSQTVTAGNGTSYTSSVSAVNGFTGAVSFSVSGLPSGAMGSFSPTAVTGSGSSTLSVSTSSTTSAGSYTTTITATSGSLVHKTTVTLVVAAPTADFTLSATPSSQTVNAGAGTSYTAAVTAVGGFTGAVSFSVSGLPSGATGSFNPTSVAGSGSSTLTVTTRGSTPVGGYTLTITGTSGSLSHSKTVMLDVNTACVTGSAGDGWHNTALSVSQTGTFTAKYDATPSASPLNAVVGLSRGAQTAYTGFAAMTRFNTLGTIDARNGGAYAAQSTIPFSSGVTYHFRLVIDVPTHSYSIYVTPGTGTELTLGTNYAFRTEQTGVTALDWWGLDVNASNPGSLTVCNFTTQ